MLKLSTAQAGFAFVMASLIVVLGLAAAAFPMPTVARNTIVAISIVLGFPTSLMLGLFVVVQIFELLMPRRSSATPRPRPRSQYPDVGGPRDTLQQVVMAVVLIALGAGVLIQPRWTGWQYQYYLDFAGYETRFGPFCILYGVALLLRAFRADKAV
jgi:hypothetical protein